MEETGLTEKLLEFAGKGMDALPGAVRTITCIAVLIIPLVMLFAGILGLVCPPKEANWHIGYRSRRIMRSEEAWFFAQKLRGIVWSAVGLILTVSSLILNGLMKGAPVDELCNKAIVYVLIQIVILLLTILGMRVFLLLRYDRSGKRKNYK